MQKFAHRGVYDNRRIYENTLSAFRIAMNRNMAIELDVRCTKDHVVVVFHDETMKRLLYVNEEISKLSYSELQNYKLGYDKIPTLKEVLHLIEGKVPILLEIKKTRDNSLLCELVMEVMRDYEGDFWIQSFSPQVLRWFKINKPNIKRGQLIMPYKRYDSKLSGLLMRSMILHFFIQPDFYSFEKNLGQSRISRFILEAFAKEYAVWTLLEEETPKLQDYQYKIVKVNL